MVERELEVLNRAGLHTRPAASLVKLTSSFKSDVFLVKDGFEINAKSIIGVMTLTAEQGAKLTAKISGEDENEAMAALEQLFLSKFDED